MCGGVVCLVVWLWRVVWARPGALGYFVLCSGITSGDAWGPYFVSGIEPKSASWNALIFVLFFRTKLCLGCHVTLVVGPWTLYIQGMHSWPLTYLYPFWPLDLFKCKHTLKDFVLCYFLLVSCFQGLSCCSIFHTWTLIALSLNILIIKIKNVFRLSTLFSR